MSTIIKNMKYFYYIKLSNNNNNLINFISGFSTYGGFSAEYLNNIFFNSQFSSKI